MDLTLEFRKARKKDKKNKKQKNEIYLKTFGNPADEKSGRLFFYEVQGSSSEAAAMTQPSLSPLAVLYTQFRRKERMYYTPNSAG
uniref:Uncharacterized protein n=1 Tax=Nelumbo nucifera TaxID=4432 RepID=A0A822XBP2_NELNU|nr:TPA_asm: hypothetical protein HUJ06_020287 [Nelumbo nucifera]